jgi:endoglucanase
MEAFELIKTLTEADGVTGDETAICETIAEYFPDEKKIIKDGSLIVYLNKKNKEKTILIDAHIDRIGMIVTHITDSGFLKVGNVGGLDMRILPASRVFIGKNRLPGVICTKPPHLSGKDSKPLEITDIVIDAGFDSKESAENEIFPGDRIMLFEPAQKLLGDVFAASALDNRASAVAVIFAARKLRENRENLRANIVLLFSSAEEVTERGAIISAYDINPDIALVIDTTFAKTHTDTAAITGQIGKGVMIGVSSTLDGELSNTLIKTAKDSDIDHQIEVMPARTGTNADLISINRGGVKTATLSIPIKYMHTQSETVSKRDIDSTVKLICAYAGVTV